MSCDLEQFEPFIDLVNRVIDLSEEKIPLKLENYKKDADMKVINIRNEWGKKYQGVFEDLARLINDNQNEDLVRELKKKYRIE